MIETKSSHKITFARMAAKYVKMKIKFKEGSA
jgi:hypothetical protein